MKTNKILHITECYFNLPDDFMGTLGNALMLLANAALQAEAYKEIERSEKCTLEALENKDRVKCIMGYELLETQ